MTSRASAVLGVLAAVVFASGCEQGRPGAAGVASTSNAMTQDEVLPAGTNCTPTGAHGKHAFTSCATCHVCGGVLQFDPAGPAVSANFPNPTFDATAKACSVACHGVPAGTFTYLFPDGNGDPQPNTVSYGGANVMTPSWYTTGAGGCTACHGDPPQNYLWHSGNHGGGNQCELCHPDVVSVNGVGTGLSTATNCGPNGTYGSCAALHANGTVDVQAKFKSTCFGCH
jgi:hypothetical protein